ncbi:MAG: hypothetical protein DWQ07_15270 [Chloroflexi bacterium]|nr:MAG: hypothetical protein DWQ07_15270 [Chloroflexota bacterium]MBL1196420.1 hypothetical protein [Chloroflexota bacterium]NOH13715.1 hypothetical protein [Chloroflexota bacterium]
MLAINQVDVRSKNDVERFIDFPFQLYAGHPNWVPPLRMDVATKLNPDKHPFFEHSEADFFLAEQDGQIVARITAIENKPYNHYHGKQQAQFYLFDCIEDHAVAEALFGKVFEWARARRLTEVVGPKGFGSLDGYGLQIEGFEHRQMMTMMNYNYPYYAGLLERLGFTKEVDFVSCYLSADRFRLPERVHRIAERALKRGSLQVKRFRNKRELVSWARKIGTAYNQAFVNNWEYYPLTEREIDFILDDIMVIADPRLIKIITHNDEAVGFLFAFPDVSKGLQKAKGRLFPTGIFHLLWNVRRTNWVALNGAGILPEFQGRGGNALLYSEMEKTIREFNFEHADLVQIAESAEDMRSDLINLGGVPFKNHRVYIKSL